MSVISRTFSEEYDEFQPLLQEAPKNRYLPNMVINLDEIPIPFEFLNGCTYDLVGNKMIAGKTERNTWTKRKAALILYIFADGIPSPLMSSPIHFNVVTF